MPRANEEENYLTFNKLQGAKISSCLLSGSSVGQNGAGGIWGLPFSGTDGVWEARPEENKRCGSTSAWLVTHINFVVPGS